MDVVYHKPRGLPSALISGQSVSSSSDASRTLMPADFIPETAPQVSVIPASAFPATSPQVMPSPALAGPLTFPRTVMSRPLSAFPLTSPFTVTESSERRDPPTPFRWMWKKRAGLPRKEVTTFPSFTMQSSYSPSSFP